jgi:hypothetical protein
MKALFALAASPLAAAWAAQQLFLRRAPQAPSQAP